MAWQSQLLRWYQKNKRDLPWRRTKDPYAIWVSEIMLQQTTVEAVIPYYHRFLGRFPTVQALAESDESEVLQYWSGLGYYSRARNLWKAAQQITELPQTVDALMRLPGIGRYTAGAIASIAFNQPAPILDGNVIRVLSRLFKIGKDPKTTVGQRYFWQVSTETLHKLSNGRTGPPTLYGDFNQALMELGATICTPESPRCPLCPIRANCQARKTGQPERYPRIQKKTQYVDVPITAALVQRGEQILIVQRPAQGLMKGMWEVPMVEGDESDLQKLLAVTLLKPLPLVRHSVLNRRLKIRPFVCQLRGKSLPTYRWILPKELQTLPTSSMNHKILQKFLQCI